MGCRGGEQLIRAKDCSESDKYSETTGDVDDCATFYKGGASGTEFL